LATAGLLLAAAGALAHDYSYRSRAGGPSPRHYRGAAYEGDPAAQPTPASPDAPAEPAPMPDASYDGHGAEGCDSCFSEALADSCGDCCGCGRCPWYASLSGLVMTRDSGNEVFTTYDASNINNQLLNTQDAEMDWRGGFEVRIGRRFGCDCNCGIEVRYWTLDEMEGHASIRRTDDSLSTPLNVGFLTIDGNPAGDYFDNAREHRISRSSEFHNVEINLLHYPLSCGCDPLQLSVLGGVRWFRFDDNLLFGSVEGGSEFGANGGADEAYIDVDVENNLVGVQMGCRADWCVGRGWKLFAAPEVGVYNNHVRNRVGVYSGNGANGVGTIPAPGTGTVDFPLDSTEDDVAFLAQLDLGVEYQFNCSWRAFVGYRAVAATGVALSDSQVPQIVIDAPEWQNIDTNGSLILHGGFAGLECRF
jgi:hypothetical protein